MGNWPQQQPQAMHFSFKPIPETVKITYWMCRFGGVQRRPKLREYCSHYYAHFIARLNKRQTTNANIIKNIYLCDSMPKLYHTIVLQVVIEHREHCSVTSSQNFVHSQLLLYYCVRTSMVACYAIPLFASQYSFLVQSCFFWSKLLCKSEKTT